MFKRILQVRKLIKEAKTKTTTTVQYRFYIIGVNIKTLRRVLRCN